MMTALLVLALLPGQAEIQGGCGQLTVAIHGKEVELFTYKPQAFREGPLILVFHGVLRNAQEYRDHACAMGDRFQAMIVAPCFPEKQFPIESYQYGGLFAAGKIQPREAWTWELIPQIANEIRRREGRPDMPYYLIGHSGGGQFLIRLSGFTATQATRIVVSNPGTYLLPSLDHIYPFGFGSLPEPLNDDETLRRFLEQPITLYLAENDLERDEHFDQTPPAERQGRTRWERGQNAFRTAQELARSKGWKCNWRLIAVPSVGHDHEVMFNHALCKDALFGPFAEAE